MTHSMIGNNDGRQETTTGINTTHDTNMTLFQIPSTEEINTIPVIGKGKRCLVIKDEAKDYGAEPVPHAPGKRTGQALFAEFCLVYTTDRLEQGSKKDIAIKTLCCPLTHHDLPLLGLWTPFNKLVSSHDCISMVQDYLPVAPYPLEYPVCQEYLDFLLNLIEELDEMV